MYLCLNLNRQTNLKMEYTAQALASLVNGEIKGNPQTTVTDFSKIEEAQKGSLTFLANPKYAHFLDKTKASIILISKNLVPEKEIDATLIVVDDAYKALAVLLDFYKKMDKKRKGRELQSFTHRTAKVGKRVYRGAFSYIGANAVIEDDVQIYPHVYIGDNVKVGKGTILYPGVKIYNDCVIGKNCIIHAGTVIGSDGFGFAPTEDGTYKKIAQIGNVVIEDDVEIGANCAIDRATMGSTIIRKGVKLDNLIQIAHNVEVGENTVMAAQVGIAGSTKIGKNGMFGGQAAITGHIKVGDNVKLTAKAGVTKSVKDNSILMGAPAFDIKQFQRSFAVFKNLAELNRQLNQMQKELEELKKKLK